MSEKKDKAADILDEEDTGPLVFGLDDLAAGSSGEMTPDKKKAEPWATIAGEPADADDDEPEAETPEAVEVEEADDEIEEAGADADEDTDEDDEPLEAVEEIERSPAFDLLAAPDLPELRRDDRARLEMQSPNRLFFYWSLQSDPHRTLRRALGPGAASYALVAKLRDLVTDSERIYPIEAEGSTWFDVTAGRSYRVEIGFYATSRPFVRVLFSNSVETPRSKPSVRRASDNDWTVTADRFARVLDVSGFKRDAFDVALVGDDPEAAEAATRSAFSRFIGPAAAVPTGFADIPSEDLRFAMLSLAAGDPLERLRWKIGPTLFSLLEASAGRLSGDLALSALNAEFGVSPDEPVEFEDAEEFGPAVYGASLINFPRKLRRRMLPGVQTFSSHSLRAPLATPSS